MSNSPRYDIKECVLGHHLFNLEKGFVLVKRYNPEKDYDDRDIWICLNHARDNKYTVVL